MTCTPARLALSGLVLLLLSGCGGSPSHTTPPPVAACVPASPSEFAYSLSSGLGDGDTVSMYTVDSCSGALKPNSPATIATGISLPQLGAESMVVDPLGRFVYVANLISNASDEATISMFTIDPATGLLAATSPATVPTGFFPQAIATDPSGKFVYTANSDDNTISMFVVDQATGVLTPNSPASVAAGWSPDGVTIHPSGKFAYAVNQDDNTISMYTVNSATGVLTPNTPATVSTFDSPFEITIDPTGKFAYVPDAYSELNAVTQYTIDQTTGVLTPNTPSYVTVGENPTAVAIDPSSKFAYVTNRIDNTISMFKIDPTTGNLTPNGVIATGSQPFRVLFDPSGKFLYVANEDSAASAYTINADGTLAPADAAATGTSSLSLGLAPVKQ